MRIATRSNDALELSRFTGAVPSPSAVGWVQRAERAGFDGAASSDHLQPWSPTQGESAFTWSWLGAAMQATTRLHFGTVTVPGGWRYQPVVLAQAIATLAAMFPGRLRGWRWVAEKP